MMGGTKGLIYFENVQMPQRYGIIASHRPVVVVSERPSGEAVQVVPLTTSTHKMDGLFCHVPIETTGRCSVALCEQVRTATVSELSRFPKGFCSAGEMKKIDAALRRLFAL